MPIPPVQPIQASPEVQAIWTGAFTDHSGTITAGGASQVLAPANPGRRILFVQNPSSQTESLFVNFTASASTAGGSIELRPGDRLIMDTSGFISLEQVNVTATTLGHPFTAKESS